MQTVKVLLLCSTILAVKSDESRIVNGIPIAIDDVPYQVAILRDNKIACGGSIISNRWILTAAHCMTNNVSRFTVRVGSKDYSTGGQLFNVEKIVAHPEFERKTYDYDVALLQLKSVITGDRFVHLATQEPAAGEQLLISGWGKTSTTTPESKYLLAAVVLVVEWEQCERALNETLTSRMICAGGDDKDVCNGDSGGPMVSNNTQYGIVSWGLGCGLPGKPGVYTNVANLLPWIKENVLL